MIRLRFDSLTKNLPKHVSRPARMTPLAAAALAALLALPTGTAVRLGTPTAETLTGTDRADRLTGDGGNDLLRGLAGNDT